MQDSLQLWLWESGRRSVFGLFLVTVEFANRQPGMQMLVQTKILFTIKLNDIILRF